MPPPGYWWVGAFCASSWLLLPWLEILTRIRRLTLPTEKKLRHKHPPNQDAFPALEGLTDEIEHLGFKQQDDTGWDWQGRRPYRSGAGSAELLTNAIRVPSGDHDGTLIVP